MKENPTSAPNFETPHAVVDVDFLNRAFKLLETGCPLDFCTKKIVSHVIRVDGAGAKVEFRCEKGHPTQWTSSELLGRQALLLNRLIPCAAVMAGLKITPLRRFLGLLQIESQGQTYMKSSAIDLLARLTNDLYLEEITRVRTEMKAADTFDLGILCLHRPFLFMIYVRIGWLISSFLSSVRCSRCSDG